MQLLQKNILREWANNCWQERQLMHCSIHSLVFNANFGSIFCTLGPLVWKWVEILYTKLILTIILCQWSLLRMCVQSTRTKVIVQKPIAFTDQLQQKRPITLYGTKIICDHIKISFCKKKKKCFTSIKKIFSNKCTMQMTHNLMQHKELLSSYKK